MQKFDPEIINAIIKSRRSIYPPQYSGEVIKKEIIDKILENANWAPTHKFTEPWRFTVFTGEGLKKLASFMSELYKEVSSEKGSFDPKKYEKLKTNPLKASHIISIGMKRDEKGSVPEIEEIEAVACAVQNMSLTATAYRVGSYWGSGGVTYFENAKPYFNLGPKDKLLGFFYLGMPKKSITKGKRKPIEDKVRWMED